MKTKLEPATLSASDASAIAETIDGPRNFELNADPKIKTTKYAAIL